MTGFGERDFGGAFVGVRRFSLFAFLLGTLSVMGFGAPVVADEELPGQIQRYSRRSIALYQGENNPLNETLLGLFRRHLPRFDYPVITSKDIPFKDFVAQAYARQQRSAGALTARQTPVHQRFGEPLVSWSRTQRLMDSALVLVPEWRFSAFEVEPPEYMRGPEGSFWHLPVKGHLDLRLSIYALKASGPELLTVKEADWGLNQAIPLKDMDTLRKRMQEQLGQAPYPEDGEAFLRALRKISPFDRTLEGTNGETLMLPIAAEILETELNPPQKMAALALTAGGLALKGVALPSLRAEEQEEMTHLAHGLMMLYEFERLFARLRQLNAFQLVGALDPVDEHRVKLELPLKETPASLGMLQDSAYQVIEYKEIQNGWQPEVVGLVRFREVKNKQVLGQTIFSRRPFELGDQYVEYPQTRFQFETDAGILPVALGSDSQWLPNVSAGINYSLAPDWGLSETYLNLRGSWGWGLFENAGESFEPQIFTTHLGITRRWTFWQWVWSIGLSGGLMYGQMDQNSESFSQTIPGARVWTGLGFQLTPEMLIAAELDWQNYLGLGNTWRGDEGAEDLGVGLSSGGPGGRLSFQYHF